MSINGSPLEFPLWNNYIIWGYTTQSGYSKGDINGMIFPSLQEAVAWILTFAQWRLWSFWVKWHEASGLNSEFPSHLPLWLVYNIGMVSLCVPVVVPICQKMDTLSDTSTEIAHSDVEHSQFPSRSGEMSDVCEEECGACHLVVRSTTAWGRHTVSCGGQRQTLLWWTRIPQCMRQATSWKNTAKRQGPQRLLFSQVSQ